MHDCEQHATGWERVKREWWQVRGARQGCPKGFCKEMSGRATTHPWCSIHRLGTETTPTRTWPVTLRFIGHSTTTAAAPTAENLKNRDAPFSATDTFSPVAGEVCTTAPDHKSVAVTV